jgi:hypothetical protein
MPAVVKSPKDEEAWSRAKAQVKKEYPDIEEGSDRFYKLTMKIFGDIAHKEWAAKSTCLCGHILLQKSRSGYPILRVRTLMFNKSQITALCPACKSRVVLPILSSPLLVLPK